MTDFYKHNPKFFIGVDCIIFGLNKGELSILLAKRQFEPEKGKWSLMGGLARPRRARRVGGILRTD